MEPTYPLQAYVCPRCFLVQIDDFEPVTKIFNETYAYFSAFSDSWLEHCRAFTAAITERLSLDASSLVVEIASNDGYLLQYFRQRGIDVLGVEPAGSVAAAAVEKGVPTEVQFFSASYAKDLAARERLASLVVGNNVLAHTPDPNDFVAGLPLILAPDGVVTMEFPHLLRLLENNQFDTIYHEHYSYLSLHSVQTMFARHGLEIFDVDELPTHGGSLRIYAQHAGGPRERQERVGRLERSEREAGLLDLHTYSAFQERVAATKRRLLSFLIAARNDGKRIVGYGAPAKGNTLLNFCGIGTDFLDFTVDRSPSKQGKLLPGTHIPVYAPERIFEERPDYVLILPWNIKAEIMTQMAAVREWGGRFVVPIPDVQVI